MDKIVFYAEGQAGSEYCPNHNDTVAYYTQIMLNDECEIPIEKPDSQTIVSIYPSLEIHKTEVLNVLVNHHGESLEGKKVVINGVFYIGIEYLAACSPSVHYFKCNTPFNGIILKSLDDEDELFSPDFNLLDFSVYGCLEYVEVKRLTSRIFEQTVNLMLWLKKE